MSESELEKLRKENEALRKQVQSLTLTGRSTASLATSESALHGSVKDIDFTDRENEVQAKARKFDECNKQLKAALARIEILENEKLNSQTNSEAKITGLRDRSQVDKKRNKEDVKTPEYKVNLSKNLKFLPDSPFQQVKLDEKIHLISVLCGQIKAVEKLSSSFCDALDVLGKRSKKLAEGISTLVYIEGLPECLADSSGPVIEIFERLTDYTHNFKWEITQILIEDLKKLYKGGHEVQTTAREVKGLSDSYLSSLGRHLGEDDKNGSRSTSPSRSQTRGKLSFSSLFSGSSFRSHKRSPEQSQSRSSRVPRSALTGSEKGRRKGRGKKEFQSATLSFVSEEKGTLFSHRARYQIARFAHTEEINQFLDTKMLDFTETCAAVFRFAHSFFKHGYHECQNHDFKIKNLRKGIAQLRKEIGKKQEEKAKIQEELDYQLRNEIYDKVPMKDICSNIDGLNFKEPDSSVTKSGYLYKKGHGITKTWGRRWFLIKDGTLYYVRGKHDLQENFVANLVLSSVKEIGGEHQRPYSFVICNPQSSREYMLQANCETDMKQWIKAMRGVAEEKLYALKPGPEGKDSDKAETPSKEAMLISRIKELNKQCADCGAALPDWAVINKGIMVCIACSGVHRSLGVQVSRVRSLGLDKWEKLTLELMTKIGGTVYNSIFEATSDSKYPKPKPDSDVSVRRAYIVKKYVHNKFIKKEEMDQKVLIEKALKAVQSDDLKALLECSAQGFDINYKDSDGRALLHHAAQSNSLLATEFCLLNGANPYLEDAEKKTPLTLAKESKSNMVKSRLEDYELKTR